jgi:hypothetical protein
MLDETILTTILMRHFPTATAARINDAARDVILLELLADDRVLVWEDCPRDRHDPAVQVFAGAPWRES